MKFILKISITALFAIALGMLLPWYTAAIAGLLGGFIFSKSGGHDFGMGFLALFFAWAITAVIITQSTGSLLPQRMAGVFPLEFLGWPALVVVTGIIGGIAGGLGSLTGGHLRRMMRG